MDRFEFIHTNPDHRIDGALWDNRPAKGLHVAVLNGAKETHLLFADADEVRAFAAALLAKVDG